MEIEVPNTDAPQTTPRIKKKATIGGGFVVHRRGDSSHRLMVHARHPYEHGSLEEAQAEASRLAEKYRREFVVFQAVASVPAPVVAKISEAA